MDVTIKSQNFTINSGMVKSALDELKEIYPSVCQLLNYDEDATNFQWLMYILGYHVRIQSNLSIFTISRYYESQIENENPILTLTCLSKHMTDDSYIVIEMDGKETRFEKDKTTVQLVNDESTSSTIKEELETINASLEETTVDEIVNKTKRKGRFRKST